MKKTILINYSSVFLAGLLNAPLVSLIQNINAVKRNVVVFFTRDTDHKEYMSLVLEKNSIDFEDIFIYNTSNDNMLREIRNAGFEPVLVIDEEFTNFWQKEGITSLYSGVIL